jgi:hypothetical protein
MGGRSALDVGELLQHEPVAEPDDVDSTDVMFGSVVAGPGEAPPDEGPVPRIGTYPPGEFRVLGIAEELLPSRSHSSRAIMELPIRCRTC